MIINDGTEQEKLLTAAQVAEQMQISQAMVWKLLHSGELRSLKIGWARRIPASAVAEFIERGQAEEAGRIAAGGAA
jgi:excisionase family DNA binding protein